MKRLLFVTTLLTLSPFAAYGYTETSSNTPCNQAILQGRQRIDRVKEVNAAPFINQYTYEEGSAMPPGRLRSIRFTINGPRVEDVMNSPLFFTDISNNIIRNCPDVGTVSVGVAFTGWSMDAGYFPEEDKVKVFPCYDLPDLYRRPQIPYGYTNCSI